MVKRYLQVKPLDDVLALLGREFSCIPSVITVPLENASGRITVGPIFAKYSVPEIHLSAMDGIAVVSADTKGASEQHPVTLPRTVRVNTGNVVPQEYDAVIMIEDVWEESGKYTIRKSASPWQHVRPAGEDLAESEMVMPSRHRIRPHETGGLATYGITEVDVITVRIGLVPTGSELVAAGTRPAPGQVVESNTLMAKAILDEVGATCIRYPFVEDTPEKIRNAIRKACSENDLVIVSAGSSAGTKDYTADVIAELGVVLVHGIATKPGKPAIIGRVDGKPVIGLPGYPLSALTVLRELVLPLMRMYGLFVPPYRIVQAQVTTALAKEIGSDEYVACTLGKVGDRFVISPQSKGAGVQMSAIRSNAYIRLPRDSEGFNAGDLVDARLLVPEEEAENALLITGSHDPAIDYLADLLRPKGVSLISTHVGSMGGILALRKDECHAAPTHLLADDGTYNITYVQKYLGVTEVDLLCVAERQQGVVSRDGLSFTDLPGRLFVNRQKGSGTRMLLDYQLKKAGIDPGTIPGYEREVTTHIAVALAVKSREADAGLCVYSAAKALNLPFVPVASERYELAIRREHATDPRVVALMEAIRSKEFKSILEQLGGYETMETGTIRQGSP
ncbi:molybdopterin biosynthesis protein [Methanoregula formicica]|uniref:Molybdenum cofactor synthesis domain protein n=1 Tax=Methanoregula formicica (strain DSM 22288 / NBRC 105244 / SMSP) TaxID=593750 RepID=L0HD88_METFS|nr:molybdopterin biosynthesis protein [Methanoregula formicica]AGB01741.1 molybdenum cofactor synthesis domain protein [Methanoregula formicica SMSP]